MTSATSTERSGALPLNPAVPVISKLSPNFGSTKGGTTVTISGTNLGHPISVRFGQTFGKITRVVSSTEIEVDAPPGTGVVDVFVKTPAGESAASPSTHFSYHGGPAVTSVEPTIGLSAGGTTVYVKGRNFVGNVTVLFGAHQATIVKVIGPGDVEVKAPAGSGVVDVTVITVIGTSPKVAGDKYTYREGDPTVTGLSPAQGVPAGGTPVTITGTNLLGATAVHFGPNMATIVKEVSASKLMVTSPAGQGTVHVTVTTPAGLSPRTRVDEFSYNVVGAPGPHPLAIRAHERAKKRRD